MSNVVELGSLDGRLCGELAAALARHVTADDPRVAPGLKGASFHHGSATALEAATAALTGLGLLAPVPREDAPGETWYCPHALTVDADDMPNALAVVVQDGDGRLTGLLAAFFCIFCYHDDLCDRRGWFTPPQHLVPAMAMLARTSYAERSDDAFRWTALAGPAMLEAGLWDEAFSSARETEDRALEADAQLAWATMPETLRHSVRSGNIGFIELTKALALGWREGRWISYRLDDRVWLKGEIALARRIVELAAEG